MGEIKSMHVHSSACVRVKGGESERLKTDIVMRQGCIMSPWHFNIYGCSDEGGENGDGNEWSRIPGGGGRG